MPIAIAAIAIAAIDRVLASPRVGIDDANITFVYARNLARGAGLVFTPGFERVEGFTSMLWTLIGALAFAAGDHAEAILLVVSVLVTLVAVVSVWSAADALVAGSAGLRSGLRRPLLALVAAWLAGLPAFYAWSALTLMDVGLWAAAIAIAARLLVAGAGAAVRADKGAPTTATALAATTAAMVLTRPEAMALVPVVILAFVVAGPSTDVGLRAARPAIVATAATLGALIVFRLLYFGHPLPTTYYAKVSPDRLYNLAQGARYLLAFARAEPLAAAAGLAALVCAAAGAWRALAGMPTSDVMRGASAVSVVVVAGLLLPLVGGGDHFAGFRFVQPFVPLMILPVVGLLVALDRRLTTPGQARAWRSAASKSRGGRPRPEPERARALATPAMALVLTAIVALSAVRSWHSFATENGLWHEFVTATEGRLMGRTLNAILPADPRPTVAAVITGGLAFTYDGRVLDLVGLNWQAMGHAPGDRKGVKNHAAFNDAVFYEAMPDVVTPVFLRETAFSACDAFSPFDQHALRYIHRDARFRAAYAAGYLDAPGRAVGAFFSRAWLERAAPRAAVVFSGPAAVCDEPPTR